MGHVGACWDMLGHAGACGIYVVTCSEMLGHMLRNYGTYVGACWYMWDICWDMLGHVGACLDMHCTK
jgi:hypothetical protein